MDVGAFVQENKRWLLGVGIGVVAFWIASGVIAATFDSSGTLAAISTQTRKPAEPLYDQPSLDAARQDQQQLAERRQTLQRELEFRPDPRYVLEGKATDAYDYLTEVGFDLRERLQKQAKARGVQLDDKALQWPSPADREGVRAVLVALAVLDELAARAFAAHDRVRAQDDLAIGLYEIKKLQVPEQRGRQPFRAARDSAAAEVRDQLDEQAVACTLRCDMPTADLLLELCRQPGKTLVLDFLKISPGGTRAGEPLTVDISVRGIAFKEPTK